MPDKSNLSLVPTPDEEAWTSQAERLYDRGEINADEARLRSGLPVSEHAPATQEAGRQAVSKAAKLEEVTEEHVPQASARREAKLRQPPKAKTAKEKAARDQGEVYKQQGIIPLGHDPYIRRVK